MNNLPIQEPPTNLKIQKYWRDHNKVTDEMANWLKVNCGCKEFHGIKDVSKKTHYMMFNKKIPKGYVCWMKVDLRLGTMNIFKDNIIYTNKYGRNPVDFEMNSIVIERTE
jgi:hypothetical protein